MIRKDVNDALNNLKKDSPKKPEEKHTKSKFDDMSPDELFNEINSNKETKSSAKKLKRISPDAQRKAPEPSGKKRIVIGELPDYDAFAEQENPTPEEKTKPESVPEEKTEKKEENKKGFFSRVKDLMYVSAEDDEENPVEEPEAVESSGDDSNFTIEEIEESTVNIPESIDEVPEKEQVQENESEKPSEEPEKVPEKKPENNSGRRKKKKKKKNSANKPNENQSGKKPSETQPEAKPEETVKTESEQEETVITEPEETVVTAPEPEETAVTESEPEETQEEEVTEKTDKPKKTYPAENKAKYSILGLVCVILAVVGVIAIINTCISNIGGGKSSKEKFAKAVYPAVIMDINSFDNPSELPNDQILSASIWSVILDKNKLSRYDERMGVVIIPAVDIENFAVELFGEDIPQLNHTTVGPVESKFYYNSEAQSYNIQVKPDTFTYAPEVTSVSKDSGNYIVSVEYVEEQPEWMEKSVSKSVEFSLAKNSSGGYKINSMKVLSGGRAE